MPSGVFEITDIPAAKVNMVISEFNLDDPAPTIVTTDQGGGLFTVTATYPDPGKKNTKTFGS
jgi:hypothetical protein